VPATTTPPPAASSAPTPVLETSDPQQLNGYGYVGNNPTTDSDPTGLCAYSDGDLCISHGSDFGKAPSGNSGHDVTSGDADCCTVQAAPKPVKKSCHGFFGCVGHWVAQHKAQIASFVAGLAVGVGCGLAIGWTGVGAVACGFLAGAAASVVGDLVEGGHSVGGIVEDAPVCSAIGAVTGGLMGGGAVASTTLSTTMDPPSGGATLGHRVRLGACGGDRQSGL
jgi:hypothetical protein